MRADAIFTREVEDGEQRVPAYFSTHVQDIDSTNSLDRNALVADLAAQVDRWNSRGSGFVMERITNFVLVITKYRPLCGSTYIPTPPWLANKHSVVNVKHEGDRCFVYAILSAMYPAARNPDRIYHYKKYENSLNLTGLTFPPCTLR